MFEKFGGFETGSENIVPIPGSDEQSMIPANLDDPRRYIKEENPDNANPKDREPGENLPAFTDKVIEKTDLAASRAEKIERIDKKVHERFISRVSKFISKNADNPNLDSEAAQKVVSGLGLKPDSPTYERLMREANLLLGIKTRDTRDRNRGIEKVRKDSQDERRVGFLHKNEIRKAQMQLGNEMVARNEGDIRWIDEIKDYIRENGNDNDSISNFWKGFNEICRSRKGREVSQFEFGDMQRTKNGILCELAAEELFSGWQDFLKKKVAEDGTNETLKDVVFTIRKATPEEDAKFKTDFFVTFDYEGETVDMPVQVKSDYSEGHWNKDKQFSESNICTTLSPFKTKEGNKLDEQRFKFFKTNPLGFFVIIPHGYGELKIAEDGAPSEKMQKLFYKKLEEQLPMLLNKIKNKRTYEAKQRRGTEQI